MKNCNLPDSFNLLLLQSGENKGETNLYFLFFGGRGNHKEKKASEALTFGGGLVN